MQKEITARIAAGLLLLVGACADSASHSGNVEQARSFYRQPVLDQMHYFNKRALREQLDLYFFGNQRRHPPAIYLAQCFALNGKGGVDLLRQELAGNPDDLTIRDITSLLSAIDMMGRYDVAQDGELMRLLSTKIEGMKDDEWRSSAKRTAATLGRDRSQEHADVSGCR